MMPSFLESAVLVLLIFCSSCSSTDDPLRHIDSTNEGRRFVGDEHTKDHFKLLQLDGSHLLIGARNVVYNISMQDFSVHQSIVWPSTESDIHKCNMYGKSQESCHNYIRVLAKDEHQDGVLVCGTNAFSPVCREYYIDQTNGTYAYKNEFSGQAISPYNPDHNSTALYLSESRQIYAGTVADFTGVEPLVYRRDVDKLQDLGIRTERSDTKCLNDPNFVGSFDDEEHVYFWLRENAVEYTNCGKAVYSRVARVCKKDQGSKRDPSTWTTFLKARLNCSLPGDFPFYFDEIEAISHVIHGSYGAARADVVYAVFNTPFSAIRGSAVCAFNMEDIRKIFQSSPFKSQPSPNAIWQAVLKSQVPSPRPGGCQKDSKSMSDEAIAFVKANPLMDEAVPSFFSGPIMIHTGVKDRFTQIAVDPQIQATDGSFYDVMFIGTDHGRVLKVVNLAGQGYSDKTSALVETIDVFHDEAPVRNLLVYREPYDNRVETQEFRAAYLVVVSDHEVRRLDLHHCSRAKSCSKCLRLRDPYCAWSGRICLGRSNGWSSKKFMQSISLGFSKNCPPHIQTQDLDEGDPELRADDHSAPAERSQEKKLPLNPGHEIKPQYGTEATARPCNCLKGHEMKMNDARGTDDILSDETLQRNNPIFTIGERSTRVEQNPAVSGVYSAESMAIAVVIGIVGALVVGFIVGYQFKKRECLRRKKDPSRSPTVTHHNGPFRMTHRPTTNGVQRNSSKSGHINAYEATPKFNGFVTPPESPVVMDMVLSLDSPLPEKKVNNDPNTNTLPKDYKVKKMYL